MTQKGKKYREIAIMLINSRKTDEEIFRIYNCVIGVVHATESKKEKNNPSSH